MAWGGGKGGDLMISLPLREAREIFERDYLMAQINRFGGNISRTAAFIGMERSALHRKLKSLGVGSAQSFQRMNGNTMKKWTASRAPAGRVAYVNGRYLPHGRAGVHIEDRGCNSATASMKSPTSLDGTPDRRGSRISTGWSARLRELGMAMPMGRAGAEAGDARDGRAATGCANGLLYLQVTRGAVRRDHAVPTMPPRPTLIMTSARQDHGGAGDSGWTKGIARDHPARQRWGRCDIKTVQLLPNLLAKTGGAQGTAP